VDELGNILREAREAKGLTLAEVQEKTRISRKYLEALEEAQYDVLPTAVHVRGYLRNYARFLNLDPRPLLERYELGRGGRQTTVTRTGTEDEITPDRPILTRDDQPFFDPVNVELAGGARRDSGSIVRIIIIIALLVAVALVANRFIPLLTGRGDGSTALTDGINEAVNNLINSEATDIAPQPTTDPNLLPAGGQTITSTSRNDLIQLPTPAPTRPSLPATLDTIRLKLEITERTWMRVTIDGDVVFEGQVSRDDGPFEWEAQQEAILRTGNAIGIFVTINDIQLGRLGARGEVVEETWTATS
jgi:transcriptional regulator with XRE-family HTH domain